MTDAELLRAVWALGVKWAKLARALGRDYTEVRRWVVAERPALPNTVRRVLLAILRRPALCGELLVIHKHEAAGLDDPELVPWMATLSRTQLAHALGRDRTEVGRWARGDRPRLPNTVRRVLLAMRRRPELLDELLAVHEEEAGRTAALPPAAPGSRRRRCERPVAAPVPVIAGPFAVGRRGLSASVVAAGLLVVGPGGAAPRVIEAPAPPPGGPEREAWARRVRQLYTDRLLERTLAAIERLPRIAPAEEGCAS